MRLFLYILLAGLSMQMCNCATKDRRCSYNGIPDKTSDEVTKPKREFKVYWNAPTMQCRSKKIPFKNLFEKYGIIQNKNDEFRAGDKVTILYDPGNFPALFFGTKTGEIKYRNGGLPQEGNLQSHLDNLKISIESGIPNKDYDGLAIINFESWKPIFRQNFGTQVLYKNESYALERKLHSGWSKAKIERTTKERFERAGRIFVESTIFFAKYLRPKATWGFYAYPYCFNHGPDCSPEVHAESDRMEWLWAQVTGLFPSLYSSKTLSSQELATIARGAIAEADRVRQNNTPILPYVWYRYRDGSFLRQEDLDVLLETIYNSNASGFVIWGTSKDVDTSKGCNALLHYITNTFGPAIARYTKGNITEIEDNYEREIDHDIENDSLDTEKEIENDSLNTEKKVVFTK